LHGHLHRNGCLHRHLSFPGIHHVELRFDSISWHRQKDSLPVSDGRCRSSLAGCRQFSHRGVHQHSDRYSRFQDSGLQQRWRNRSGISFAVTQKPYFYQTWWFLASCIACALACLYLLYLARLKQVTRQVRGRMEESFQERELIARELHDTMLQSFQGALLFFQTGVAQLPDCSDVAKAKEKLETLSTTHNKPSRRAETRCRICACLRSRPTISPWPSVPWAKSLRPAKPTRTLLPQTFTSKARRRVWIPSCATKCTALRARRYATPSGTPVQSGSR